MTPLEALNKAYAAGFEIWIVADDLDVIGGDDLGQAEYDALLDGLAKHKPAIIEHIRESAYRDLCRLTSGYGLCWALHDKGRAIFMDYPDEGDHFTPQDRFFIQDLFFQASPLPHERRHELLRLQDEARQATEGTPPAPDESLQSHPLKKDLLKNAEIKLPI